MISNCSKLNYIFTMKHKTTPLSVIAGLTRNPLRGKVSSSRSRDGGSLSAMTVIGCRIIQPSLASFM